MKKGVAEKTVLSTSSSKAKSVGGGGGRKMLLFFWGKFSYSDTQCRERRAIYYSADYSRILFSSPHFKIWTFFKPLYAHLDGIIDIKRKYLLQHWMSVEMEQWMIWNLFSWMNQPRIDLTNHKQEIYDNLPNQCSQKRKKRVYLSMENISPLMPFIPSVTIMESVGWRWGWKRGWGWNLCMMFVWARSSMKKRGEKQTNRYPECVLF